MFYTNIFYDMESFHFKDSFQDVESFSFLFLPNYSVLNERSV